MKLFTIWKYIVFVAIAITAPLSTFGEEYKMNGIPLDDPRWKNTLDRVNNGIAAKAKVAAESGEEKTVEILQHIKDTSYLARARTPQKVAGSVARALGNSIVPAGEWKMVRLNLPANSKKIADGEKFLRKIQETDETYEYTTRLGVKATVKVIRPAGSGEEFALLSMEQFVSRLRGGESWTVTVTQLTSKCRFCGGAKRVNGAKCPRCRGVGGDAIQRVIVVGW